MDITPETFKYTFCFAGLDRQDIQDAIDTMDVEYWGVRHYLWSMMDEPMRTAKRDLCFNRLVAWYLTAMHPEALVGMVSNPLLPLKSKKIKNISLEFNQYSRQNNALSILESNPFGMLALQDMQSAPEPFTWK